MKEFDELFDLVQHLRTRCPWDREQTFETMTDHVMEEARELVEAIGTQEWAHVSEELGDTLFNLLFVANLAEEQGLFTLKETLEGSRLKMIRRHPHVFGDVEASTPEEALKAFQDAKAAEKNND